MNLALFHDLTFGALYVALAIATFVAVERLIFFGTTRVRLAELERGIHAGQRPPEALLARASVPAQACRKMLAGLPVVANRDQLEDLSEEVYLDARARLARHLWILDTVVTASPLLGLLGTILGIIDTFTALARSGISDPSGVSAGIGAALLATALGISVALFGLLFFNAFQESVERVADRLKVLILRLSSLRAT